MNQTLLLYTAIVVFALLIIGLVLTVVEFSRAASKERAHLRKEHSVGE